MALQQCVFRRLKKTGGFMIAFHVAEVPNPGAPGSRSLRAELLE